MPWSRARNSLEPPLSPLVRMGRLLTRRLARPGCGLLAAFVVLGWSPATADEGAGAVELYFFWSTHCPHCLRARPFVESLPNRFP